MNEQNNTFSGTDYETASENANAVHTYTEAVQLDDDAKRLGDEVAKTIVANMIAENMNSVKPQSATLSDQEIGNLLGLLDNANDYTSGTANNPEAPQKPTFAENTQQKPDLQYILTRIDAIIADSEHIKKAPLGNVQARETTNQRMIALLEMMYREIAQSERQKSAMQDDISKLASVMDLLSKKTIPVTALGVVQMAIQQMFKNQPNVASQNSQPSAVTNSNDANNMLKTAVQTAIQNATRNNNQRSRATGAPRGDRLEDLFDKLDGLSDKLEEIDGRFEEMNGRLEDLDGRLEDLDG